MSNILFVNGNLHGHVNPTLPLVKELIDRGEKIWYFGADSFQKELEEAGAVFLESGGELDAFYKNYRPTGNHPFFMILEYMIRLDETLIPVILEKAGELRPDCLICDSVLGAGRFLSRILGIPAVGSFTSFALSRLPVPDEMLVKGYHPQLDEFYNRLEALCLHYHLKVPAPLEFFQNPCDLNIVYTSEEFNPGSGQLDGTYHFTGPSLRKEELKDFPLEEIRGKKVVYISLGTINTRFLEFYEACLECFREFDGIVVMSVGKKCRKSDFYNVPDNVIISQYVPQLEVLENSILFITHGGMNSVSEAISYGVPMIVVPMMNDQFLTARQVVKMGCGVTLDSKEITAERMKAKADEVMGSPDYYDACRKLQNSFRAAGGFQRAADLIQEFLFSYK